MTRKNCWLLAVISCVLTPQFLMATVRHEYRFQCSDRLDRFTCQRRIDTLRHIIERQGSRMPADWTWTLVADSDWPELSRRFQLKYEIAFTRVAERRTVINALLFEKFDRSVWEWAVAHETAHVICDLVDERATNRVAFNLAGRTSNSGILCPKSSAVEAD